MTLPAIAGRVLFGGVRVARASSVPTLLERLQAGDGAAHASLAIVSAAKVVRPLGETVASRTMAHCSKMLQP